jgi:hypothetical protein
VGPILACNDDECGLQSEVVVPVMADQTYKIRVGGFNNNVGSGVLSIDAPKCICPASEILGVFPPDGTVDARQPSPLSGTPLQGIGGASEPIEVQLAPTATGATNCFSLCETGTGGWPPNAISSVMELGGGEYRITLARPITPGEATRLTYNADDSVIYYSHPSNVNADPLANPLDILRLIDAINNVFTPPHGLYSTDIDRSGIVNPSDILREIDLLNGADAFPVWNNTSLPSDEDCP